MTSNMPDNVVVDTITDRTFFIRKPKQRTSLAESETTPNETSHSESNKVVVVNGEYTPERSSDVEAKIAMKCPPGKPGNSGNDGIKETPPSIETLKQRMRTVRNRHLALRRSKYATSIPNKVGDQKQRATEIQSSNSVASSTTSAIIEELKDVSMDDLETALPQKITDIRSRLFRIKGKKKKKAFVQNLIDILPEKQKKVVTQMLLGRWKKKG